MKKFTKDMLRDEDIVMYKNGEIRIVKNNELYDDHDRPQFSIDLYDKDLKCLECLRGNPLDIVKVYRQIWKREEPTITSIERVLLENVEKKYKYITRDHDSKLYLFGEKPTKENVMWLCKPDSYIASLTIYSRLFPMVKWEDEEPWLIEDLLKLQTKEDK